MADEENRPVVLAYGYYQNEAGDWVPVTMAGTSPISREVQHNVAGYVAEDDIIAAALAPIYTPCSFRVEAAFSAGGILRATITRAGDTQVVNFNGGVALNINGLYRFDMMVHDGDTINYRYSADATILVFRVQEVASAVS